MPAVKALSREPILAAARALLEEEGLPGFSVRTLADRLEVEAAALRWHVGTRDRLLVDIVDDLLAGVCLPDPEAIEWQDWLRVFAASMRETFQGCPRSAPVIRDLMNSAPRSLEITATCQYVLRRAGYVDRQLLEVYNALIGFIIGFNYVEVTQQAALTNVDSVTDLRSRLTATAAAHPSPYVKAMIDQQPDPSLVAQAADIVDTSYRAGLEALLAGLPAPATDRPAAVVNRSL